MVDKVTATKKCVWCDHDLPGNAKYCEDCKSPQGLCVVCKKPLPPGARRCTSCNKNQTWWGRRLDISNTTLALLTAIISVVSTGLIPILLYFKGSDTTFKVTGSDENQIIVKVWNTGKKPSALVGYRLIFDDLPKRPSVTLEPNADDQKEKSVILPEKEPVIIALGPPTEGGTDTAIRQLLQTRDPDKISLTVEIDIRESWSSENESRKATDRFKANRITTFLPRLNR